MGLQEVCTSEVKRRRLALVPGERAIIFAKSVAISYVSGGFFCLLFPFTSISLFSTAFDSSITKGCPFSATFNTSQDIDFKFVHRYFELIPVSLS